MTIESPAEMVTEHDTLRQEAETIKATPKAKRTKKKSVSKNGRTKSKKTPAKKTSDKKSKARPPKKSKRASKKASKSSKGVKTTSRSGKKITRAKAGGKGILASKGLHVLVVRVDAKVHASAWKKARAKELTLNSWLASVIAKAAK